MNLTPEQQARLDIDAALEAAGWILQNRDAINLAAGPGVALREARMAPRHGFADYLLCVNGKAVGAIEARPAGHTLSGVEIQSGKYAAGQAVAVRVHEHGRGSRQPRQAGREGISGLPGAGGSAQVHRVLQRAAPQLEHDPGIEPGGDFHDPADVFDCHRSQPLIKELWALHANRIAGRFT